jgi:MoaA/NifB/PqqE/SkfB family radical SAM enzyme
VAHGSFFSALYLPENGYIGGLTTHWMMRPREATLAITYRCNARCAMCNIWKVTDHEELPPEEYLKLPNSLRTINVTGGEPFLRKDIVELVAAIHKAAPKSRIVVSSNGFLTEKIRKEMVEMRNTHPRLGIGISVDGLDSLHDSIRGVPGGFKRAIETVEVLKAEGFEDVRLGMTIVKENADKVVEVYELSKKMGVEFTTTVAHNSDIYFRKSDNTPSEVTHELRGGVSAVQAEHLRSLSAKKWFRAYHLAGIVEPTIREGALGRCEAAFRFFFMDPKGDVYPCIVMNKVIGNIKDFESLDDLFSSPAAADARKLVRACRSDCWMVCNLRSTLVAHPGRSVAWIVKNKPKAHLSRPR